LFSKTTIYNYYNTKLHNYARCKRIKITLMLHDYLKYNIVKYLHVILVTNSLKYVLQQTKPIVRNNQLSITIKNSLKINQLLKLSA